jgi:hypothetical protein
LEGGGPIHTASSAYLTKGAFLSASLKTATVEIPISLAERITRSAISPLLATRIFFIIEKEGRKERKNLEI